MGVVQQPPEVLDRAQLPDGGAVYRDTRGRVCNRFCPVCQHAVHAKRTGDWVCEHCGAAGGEFPGRRMYLTAVPNSDEGRAAAARLAAQW